MTTPGATEAVTPEQRAREIMDKHFHGFYPDVCADIAQTIREAEANALRRAVEVARSFGADPHAVAIREAIRSLLPKEERQSPDAPR